MKLKDVYIVGVMVGKQYKLLKETKQVLDKYSIEGNNGLLKDIYKTYNMSISNGKKDNIIYAYSIDSAIDHANNLFYEAKKDICHNDESITICCIGTKFPKEYLAGRKKIYADTYIDMQDDKRVLEIKWKVKVPGYDIEHNDGYITTIVAYIVYAEHIDPTEKFFYNALDI